MRTFSRSSRLEAPAELVWDTVLRTETFAYVAGPWLRFPAASLADARWVPGLELEDRLLLFGFIPLGRHRIRIAEVDMAAYRLRTEEGSRLLRQWEHEIVVTAIDERSCRYTDRLTIDAGALTGPMSLLAGLFFRYRHYRWRRLARQLTS
jgi:ligand-binding SRPBCC domain-containing protein